MLKSDIQLRVLTAFLFSLPSSKALSDLHIDDLLEPEGYDTLPGLFLFYLCMYTPKARSTQKGD